MAEIFKFFNQGWVGSLIGIIGLIFAFITYKKSKVGARLSYQWESTRIIDKNPRGPQEIGITYKGQNVERVIKTTIVLWNSGNSTVYGNNVIKTDPVRFEFNEDEMIIGLQIIKKSKDVNNLQIELDSNSTNIAKCSFEYLDPNDGAVIEILHTDDDRYPKVLGTIVGMPEGLLNWSASKKKPIFKFSTIQTNRFSNFSLFLALIIGVLSLFVGLGSLYSPNGLIIGFLNNGNDISKFNIGIFIFTGFSYTVLPAYALYVTRRKFPKNLFYEK